MNTRYLHGKLRSMYLLGLFLPLCGAIMIFISIHSLRTLRAQTQLNENVVHSLAINIETCMQGMESCSLSWANQAEMSLFYKTVTDNKGTLDQLPISIYTNYSNACVNVIYLSGINPLGLGYYPIQNPDCIYYLCTNPQGVVGLQQKGMASEPWFAQAVSARGRAVYCPIAYSAQYPKEKQGVFSVARLVTELDTRKALGVIKVDISARYFDDLFVPIDIGSVSAFLLTDTKGQVVYSTNEGLFPAGQALPQPNGYTAYCAALGNTGWSLRYYVSAQDQSSLLLPTLLIILLIALLAMLFSLAAFRANSRHLTDPLNRILQTINAAQKGDFLKKIALGACEIREFTLIANQYDSMVDSLREHIQREYDAKISQQHAELRALQMQINPHFLYNTMNGLVALNRIGATKLLEESIISLTEMFRYSCSGTHETTVREEFGFVQKYLALQQLRYQERLCVSIDLDDACRAYRLPKLLLQPLVENAVIHGVEPVDRPVHIAVIGQLATFGKARMLALIVADDGMGAEGEAAAIRPGLALENIRKRIESLSPDAFLSIQRRADCGVVSCILLPIAALSKEDCHDQDHHSGR